MTMHKTTKSTYLLQALKKRIGTMSSGERFPSVRTLMKEYGVSQFSLTPAINRLEEEELIERIVGKGTFVSRDGNDKLFRLVFMQEDWAIDEFAFHSEIMIRRIAEERRYLYKKVVYQFHDGIYDELPFDHADAIIMAPCRRDFTAKQLDVLLNAPIPVIMFRVGFPHSSINFVNGDNVASGMMAANHFIDKGHRKLAILLAEPDGPTGHELLYGFTQYAASKGVKVTVIDCKTRYGEIAAHNAYSKMKEYCSSQPIDFSALFVSSDGSSLGVLKAIIDHGIKIPEDLQVMGFGGSPQVELFRPSLSTVETPIPRMVNAVYEIIDQCAAENKTHGCSRLIYPCVVERESTLKK